MRGRPALITLAALAVLLALPESAQAGGGVKVGWYSQQVRPSHAAAGAHISVSAAQSAETTDRAATPNREVVVMTFKPRGGAASKLPPPFPPLSTSASILK